MKYLWLLWSLSIISGIVYLYLNSTNRRKLEKYDTVHDIVRKSRNDIRNRIKEIGNVCLAYQKYTSYYNGYFSSFYITLIGPSKIRNEVLGFFFKFKKELREPDPYMLTLVLGYCTSHIKNIFEHLNDIFLTNEDDFTLIEIKFSKGSGYEDIEIVLKDLSSNKDIVTANSVMDSLRWLYREAEQRSVDQVFNEALARIESRK